MQMTNIIMGGLASLFALGFIIGLCVAIVAFGIKL